MSSPSGGGNWKNPRGNSGKGRPGDGVSRRAWHQGPAPSRDPGSTGGPRLFKFLLAGFGTAALVGLIVLVIYMFAPPRAVDIVTIAPRPTEGLAAPDLAPGVTAAESIVEWARDHGGRIRAIDPLGESPDINSWKERLDPAAKSLVVNIAAPGGADASGPYFWMIPTTARSPRDEHKLRVKEILDRLSGLPAEQPKLLILDGTRSRSPWVHGALFDDFARGVKALEAEITKVPNLAVILSADEGQHSHLFPERKRTAFQYFLAEGLRGGAGTAAGRIGGGELFDFVKKEVERFAAANRDEPQTPLLLPKDSGRDRIAKLSPSDSPTSGYQAPAAPEAPQTAPAEFEAAWTEAEALGIRSPAPDGVDPVRWREYLDCLLLWEFQLRVGAKNDAVAKRVTVLASELRSPPAVEPLCAPAALPVGTALGLPKAEVKREAFGKVWNPPEKSSAAEEWNKILGPNRENEAGRRVAASAALIEALLRDGPTPENLKRADDVLAAIDGSRVSTTETHYIRMLHRHLDATSRAPLDLVARSIALRVAAETVAWLGGATTEHSFAEFVYPWIAANVEISDASRAAGQDLLFASDEAAWSKARTLLDRAEKHLRAAETDATIIRKGLNIRNRVFCRLPYYARWAAAAKGKRTAAETNALLTKIEEAARGAHTLAALLAPPANDAERLDRLSKIAATAAQTEADFRDIVKTFDDDALSLSNTPHPSNLAALDAALEVPFLPARDRLKLLGFARAISHQLAVKSEQGSGTIVPPEALRAAAQREGRMALAILGDRSPELRQTIAAPPPGTELDALRDAGEAIGKQFRALEEEIAKEMEAAAKATPLASAKPGLARAAYLARLCDPAAPPRAGEAATTLQQKRLRHDFLLAQARRTLREGWADITQVPEDQWYCRKASSLFIRSAESLMLEGANDLPPEEMNRRTADCKAVEKLAPTRLTLTAAENEQIADEKSWEYGFTLGVNEDRAGPVGYPVSWLELPGPPFTPTKELSARSIFLEFLEGGSRNARKAARFTVGKSLENSRGAITPTILYRGHLLTRPTKISLAAIPSLEYITRPPLGAAAFSVLADDTLVSGAVVLLIDLSESMNDPLEKGGLKKIQVLHDALDRVLAGMPTNTSLTIAFFWGDAQSSYVEPLKEATKLLWKGDEGQRREIMKAVRAKEPVAGGNTPLAKSVRRILSKDEGSRFWPKNASGTRILSVLTDGADNWDKAKAGRVVLDALLHKDAAEDTALHLILFGLDETEEREAIEQYKVLEDPEPYRDVNRTPASLWRGVRSADAVAERLQQAMLPRIMYRKEETAKGEKPTRLLRVTLPREEQIQPSPALEAGVYNLFGLRANQKLQLEPGDRLKLKARARDGAFDLYLPPNAYDVAGRVGRRRAASPRSSDGAGIYLTVPQLTIEERTGWCDLKLTATLEPTEVPQGAPVLRMERPKFAWFDVKPLEGKPFRPQTSKMKIENVTGLAAPSWGIEVTQWDRDRDSARPPEVTGAWVERLPGDPTKYPIDAVGDPTGSVEKLPKTATVAGAPVRLVSVGIEEIQGAGDLPEGKYLTFRFDYGQPGKLVFLRPGRLKGPRQPFLLTEQHLYFDEQRRYTARFGPLTPEDLSGAAELELYSVEEIRAAAAKSGRLAVLRLPEQVPVKPFPLPTDLQLSPAGK